MRLPFLLQLSFCALCISSARSSVAVHDIVIYGATPGGVATAISAAMLSSNSSIVILEPSAYIGGMSVAGGIGLRDIGVESTLENSIAHAWTLLNAKHYGVAYPVYQPDMWVAEASLWTMIKAHPNIQVILNSPLAEKNGVEKTGLRITSVTNTDGQQFGAKLFVDASYEGDLARFAGVHYTYGRESVSHYNESLAGVRPYTNTGNFLSSHPSSAVLNATTHSYVKYVDTEPLGPIGSADDRMMGYSFRLCVTKSHNRTAFFAPPGYKKEDFILLQRYVDSLIAAGSKGVTLGEIVDIFNYRGYPPGSKFDVCDSAGSAFTSDAINLNKGYVNGSYAERKKIYDETLYYVLGLIYYLSRDVSQEFTRNSTNEFGLCADQWLDNKHVPTQLYVREGLRIVGDEVLTQNRIIGGRNLKDSIAVGSWVYDVHVVSRTIRRLENESVADNEGQYFTRISGTGSVYDIPMSTILPKKTDTSNLIVPVCNSASHVAYSSIRVEPTFMLLGQAAGVLATLAVRSDVAVQDVSVSQVQAQLTAWGLTIHSQQ